MKKTYIVAVSGGIDSVVLLHMLSRQNDARVIVAHFDHGIRGDSADDARFVAGLAKQYGFPFVEKREELGARASEAFARERRYMFLREQAKKFHGHIVTAHHADDALETIAINITRGTGWRGLAVFAGSDISRPLLGFTKTALRRYALRHRLEWVEDSTNMTLAYLRNRLRARTAKLSFRERQQLAELRSRQIILKHAIEKEAKRFLRDDHTYERYFLISLSNEAAIELLRQMVKNATEKTPSRPQAERALLAIKTAKPGAKFQMGDGVELQYKSRQFIVVPPQKVL